MSELNERFPGILLGYVAGTGISLTAEACNELSKFVSGIEVERDRAQGELKQSVYLYSVQRDQMKRMNEEMQSYADCLNTRNTELAHALEALKKLVRYFDLGDFRDNRVTDYLKAARAALAGKE